ncbi:MAG: hypothetical protein BGO03_12075 [Mesorhizobium sp. 61-13]|nr:MAG: hypothetical protein BGO03_12075 [Mesorhizobium sp. 61-13]
MESPPQDAGLSDALGSIGAEPMGGGHRRPNRCPVRSRFPQERWGIMRETEKGVDKWDESFLRK